MNISLATRYSIIVVSLTTLLGAAAMFANTYYLANYSQEATRFAHQQLTETLEKQLINDAQALTDTIANNTSTAVSRLNFNELTRQLNFLNHEDYIRYVFIYDRDYRIIHDNTPDNSRQGLSVRPWLPSTIPQNFSEYTQKHGQFVHVGRHIIANGQLVGMISVAMSYNTAESDIHTAIHTLTAKNLQLQKQIATSLLWVISLGIFLMGGVVFLLSRRMLGPLQQLAEQCRFYADGHQDIAFALERNDEIGQLAEALEAMRSAATLSQSKAEALAYQDPLTQLPNRRHFNKTLDDLIKDAHDEQSQAAIIFIDLDRFKEVNDTVGHMLGDQLLKDAAQRLMYSLKTLEKNHVSAFYLARLGGDEFILLIKNRAEEAYLRMIAEHILSALKKPFKLENHRFSLSASIGIAIYPKHADNAIDLLKLADIAMYDIKTSGRQGYRFFDEHMNNDMAYELMIRSDIIEALTSGQLALVYQPIINLQTGETAGAEALIRWHHPQHGLIRPDHFIPILEKDELIIALTLWVLRQAFYDLKHVFLPIKSDFKLSVNISGNAIEDDLVRHEVTTLMQRYDVPSNCLHVELTETSLMENIATCMQTLQAWHDAGAEIWVDDFGTGYSSLNYLHQLPINGLKIDRSFVEAMQEPASLRIVETIINLAKALQLDIVAEGIETTEQNDILKDLGSQSGQGYLFSQPLTLDDLATRLTTEAHLA